MHQSLESSFEKLITAGGDHRLLPGIDGLNPYGCCPTPRDAVPFGSCTCSSPSPRGFKRAMASLERLRQADSPIQEGNEAWREHREQLKRLLLLPGGVDIAFAPSGTDVELLALTLVMMQGHQRVVNIVVGPTEVGSGTPLAAAGRHYDSLVPCGDRVIAGQPVCRGLAESVTVETVDIRDERGKMLEEPVIDSMVTELVANAVSDGAHALLHVVAHSKTGVHAPSLNCIEWINRHVGSDVSVVVDAAQGRVSRRGLHDVLSCGHMVIFTGSKFYGGPPFSGALFVPQRWRPTNRDLDLFHDVWAEGLGRYFTSAEMPESWSSVRQRLPDTTNIGAILRWSAALAEIEAYYQVSSADRLAVLRAFERDVPNLFGDSEFVRLMPVFEPVLDESQTRLLESKTTVFAFRVEVEGRMLDRSELKWLHEKLNQDISHELATAAEEGRQKVFHLGQPVAFRDGSAALRIALGSELVVRIATEQALGASLETRLDWLRAQLDGLRTKIEELAARHPAAALGH